MQIYQDIMISHEKIFLGSLEVFIMASAYFLKAEHSFRCCFGGKAVQCHQKDFQYDEQDFGRICNDSRNSLAKHPDTNTFFLAFKYGLVSSGITHHFFMHVVILFEMITFTIKHYFISLKYMSMNSSYSII